MASEKAKAQAIFIFETVLVEDGPIRQQNQQRLLAALDAAAAVDGDAQREALVQFMIRNSFATGNGDTHADLLAELEVHIQERGDAQWNAAIEEAAKTVAKRCKCSGAMWLWAHEISSVGSQTDDTKYNCHDQEFCELVDDICSLKRLK